jgi:Ca2+-binding RTX toxin-like protein
MIGLLGNDALTGNGGDDWLFGGLGNDAINGNAGGDWLFGGPGNDKLTGGTGADNFVFNQASFGADMITDFHISEGDKIDLRGLNLNYTDLAISQSGTNTTLITIGTDTITLNKVDASSLPRVAG